MAHLAKGVCALSTTAFAGAALYITAAEHPARMQCKTSTAVAVWKPSYQKGAVMQASLAVVSCISGATAWKLTGERVWLVSGLVMGSIIFFTLAIIKPVNNRLLAATKESDMESAEMRELLVKWGRLHALRMVASAGATLILYHHVFKA